MPAGGPKHEGEVQALTNFEGGPWMLKFVVSASAPSRTGECKPCSHREESVCFCGATRKEIPCGSSISGYSCGRTCGKVSTLSTHSSLPLSRKDASFLLWICSVPQSHGLHSCLLLSGQLLSCGNHRCPLKCHAGPCLTCPTDASLRTCPCGHTALTVVRTSCLDPIPTCTNTCGRTLEWSAALLKSEDGTRVKELCSVSGQTATLWLRRRVRGDGQ